LLENSHVLELLTKYSYNKSDIYIFTRNRLKVLFDGCQKPRIQQPKSCPRSAIIKTKTKGGLENVEVNYNRRLIWEVEVKRRKRRSQRDVKGDEQFIYENCDDSQCAD